ncbi:methyltransferase domain-containing protein [Paenibacillus baimaensis]|uniref:methyltransferase domain-containing protein n=1 Tax=Paenibacillus baimaensis TaxID=2982185 RepID=UPI0038CD77BA
MRIPLAFLGGSVTIVDISPKNKRYALMDVFEIDLEKLRLSFDIVYLEAGILHYFADLTSFAHIVYELLKVGGRLVYSMRTIRL